MKRFVWPLLIFAVLVGFLYKGLDLNPREVPSPLIGKPAPAFALAQLHEPSKTIGPADMAGKVWLLNVWASWCVGLNYKDVRSDGIAWLERFGDPYAVSAFDGDGRVGIDFGVYGVPETFVIDKRGTIRFKHIGPVTPEVVQAKLLPLVKELERE
jgi:cytochrome c biogenesis protein CcmG/thiol:disulfide interchange protein DsbE